MVVDHPSKYTDTLLEETTPLKFGRDAEVLLWHREPPDQTTGLANELPTD